MNCEPLDQRPEPTRPLRTLPLQMGKLRPKGTVVGKSQKHIYTQGELGFVHGQERWNPACMGTALEGWPSVD